MSQRLRYGQCRMTGPHFVSVAQSLSSLCPMALPPAIALDALLSILVNLSALNYCDQIPENNNLQEGRFISTHDFKSCSPWFTDSIAADLW